MSTIRTRLPSSDSATARFRVDVVLATPPFWFAKAITRAFAAGSGSGGRAISSRAGASSGGDASCSSSWGRVKRPASRISGRSFVLGPDCPAQHPVCRKNRIAHSGELSFSLLSGREASPPPAPPPPEPPGSARAPLPPRPGRARLGATFPPRERALCADRAAPSRAHIPAPAARSAPAAPEPVVPLPCSRRYPVRQHMSVTKLALDRADRGDGLEPCRRLRAQPEERLVERLHEFRAIPVLDHLDEHAADEVTGHRRRVAGGEQSQTLEQIGSLSRRLSEESRRSQ